MPITFLNRPLGIWAIAVYSLYNIFSIALNFLWVSSESHVDYVSWDFFLFGGLHILLAIGLLVSVIALRKIAIPIIMIIMTITMLELILSAFIFSIAGGINQEIIVRFLVPAAAQVIILGIIWWYLAQLRTSGTLR